MEQPARWLLMLYAYLDESGQEQKDWMVVAGFLGNENQWKRYGPLWSEAISPRLHLHMADLRFRGNRHKQLLERAGAVPNQCGLIGLMGTVRFADYEDLVVGRPDEKLFNGYIACCSGLITNALRGIPSHERLELVFEEQHQYGWMLDIAIRALLASGAETNPEMFMRDGTPRLAKWSFVPKGSTSLLEVADYFAYAVMQVHRNPKSIRANLCRPILQTGDGEGLGCRLSRDRIREIVVKSQIQYLYDELVRKFGRPS